MARGATYYSLQHERPVRIDFYRAQVVDGLGNIIRERLLAIELDGLGEPRLKEPEFLGDLIPAPQPPEIPDVASLPEATHWLHANVLLPFLEEVRQERLKEVKRIAHHVEISLTELLHKVDEEIGRAQEAVERGEQGAEGRLAQAEARHDELMQRRERRRKELEQQRSLSLQSVERIASILVVPHPERQAPEVQRLRPDPRTEAVAMAVAMEYERSQGRQVYDVSDKNLGYDLTSVDLNTGELRLIEVKGLAGSQGAILLTPNERRVAEDRRDCYWLYIVTDCAAQPRLLEPIKDPARFPWNEVRQVSHYYLSVEALTRPIASPSKEDIEE